MRRPKGVPTDGLQFYKLLQEDDEFCAELGRAVLAAGRLESALIRHIQIHAPGTDTDKATLGKLIALAEKNGLVTPMLEALRLHKEQRNYLTHQIHTLLSTL